MERGVCGRGRPVCVNEVSERERERERERDPLIEMRGGKIDGTPLYSPNRLPDLVICVIVLKLM